MDLGRETTLKYRNSKHHVQEVLLLSALAAASAFAPTSILPTSSRELPSLDFHESRRPT
jgi:hypothetical protein